MIDPEKIKIAIVVSHPIQHFCPQYVSFAKNPAVTLKVFFGSALGYKKYRDENFKQEIAWDNLELDKFDHVFLNGDAVIQPDKNLDAPSLIAELESFGPDLLISYGYFQLLQRRAKSWAVKNKIPVAYISDSELRHQRNQVKEWVKGFFLKSYFSTIHYFLSVGNANEAFYRKYGVKDEKLLRMHFPIDIKQYQGHYLEKTVLRNSIREQYNIGNEDTVLLVVGKLSPWKNQDHLMEATKLLADEGYRVHTFIVGSGEMKEAWEARATALKPGNIYLTGFVNINELPAWYAAADIYVHPASLEPHSIAVSEAIYMGCPVIISDRCGSYGSEDDVQEGKTGFVYDFGNITQLAEKIKLLINDANKKVQMGQQAHDAAVQFQQSAHYTILEQLINKLKTRDKTLLK